MHTYQLIEPFLHTIVLAFDTFIRQRVFDLAHHVGVPGVHLPPHITLRVAKYEAYWPMMERDIASKLVN